MHGGCIFLMTWKRSEWDGKIYAGMKGKESAFLAALLSTISLSRMPLCPGTQRRMIGIGIVEKVVVRVRIRATRGCEEEGLETVGSVVGESD